MQKVSDLRGLSEEELHLQCQDLAKEIFELSSELAVSRKLDKPHLLKNKKRQRARILTVLKEKQMQKGS